MEGGCGGCRRGFGGHEFGIVGLMGCRAPRVVFKSVFLIWRWRGERYSDYGNLSVPFLAEYQFLIFSFQSISFIINLCYTSWCFCKNLKLAKEYKNTFSPIIWYLIEIHDRLVKSGRGHFYRSTCVASTLVRGIQQHQGLNWATCSLLMQTDDIAVTLRRTGKKGGRQWGESHIHEVHRQPLTKILIWWNTIMPFSQKTGLFTAKTLLVLFLTCLQ